MQPKQLQPQRSSRDPCFKRKTSFSTNPCSVSCDVSIHVKGNNKKQSSQFVCLRSETWRSIHLHCQLFKLPPLPKFHTKNTMNLPNRPYAPVETTDLHGRFSPEKKHHWVLPASSHRPARNVWVENGGKVESCSVGNPFLFGERPMGPIFKGGSFSVRAGKMTKITFYTPEVLQHSPYVSDKYPKGIQDPLPSIMFWLGLCLIIFGGSLTIG